jgi:hypothetical protein
VRGDQSGVGHGEEAVEEDQGDYYRGMEGDVNHLGTRSFPDESLATPGNRKRRRQERPKK